MPADPLTDFLNTLNLAAGPSATTSEDTFTGPSQWMPHGRVFGGQVLAQCLVAAQRTIPDDRPAHSLHGYFLRAGDINLPITFSVDRLRDGRSFSTRRVQAFQKGEAIFSMIASFQHRDKGLEHQDVFPTDIPAPETLPSAAELIGESQHPVAQYWAKARPFDMRYVTSPIYFKVEGENVAHQAVWLRSIGQLPDDQAIHRAAIAYASDYSILESSYRRHGIAWTHPGLKSASLDHAMWFHRDGRADEWMLYVQESPSAQGGRGLSLGKIFRQDGRLLATVAQEGMIRVPEMAD
ncbi:MAG: acyl-CoA thioesterase [Rhodoluna sp.]